MDRLTHASASLTRNLCAAISLAFANGFAADWPGWLGPARDGHAAAGSVVPKSLPLEPRRVWAFPIGEGHAPPVAAGDKVFYLDAQNGKEVAHAIDRTTGRELWRAHWMMASKTGRPNRGHVPRRWWMATASMCSRAWVSCAAWR